MRKTFYILLMGIACSIACTGFCFGEDSQGLSFEAPGPDSTQQRPKDHPYHASTEAEGLYKTATVLHLAGLQAGTALGDSPEFTPVLSGEGSRPITLVQAKGEEDLEEVETVDTIPDPLEPVNRVFFQFNDKLYFWFLKPVATAYKAVVPEPARVGVNNFFFNLAFPVRFVNCLLQGKVEGAGMEFARFSVNTLVGLAGFIDVATGVGTFKKYNEDLGQTFGFWGSGAGFYINWPILGPSDLRDTIGMVGDTFLDPLSYLGNHWYAPGARAFNVVNDTSLRIGDYESLKEAALDPYVALREAYYQNRKAKIKE